MSVDAYIEKIANILEDLKEKNVNYRESFSWKFDTEGLRNLILDDKLNELEAINNLYEKNIFLKEIFQESLKKKNKNEIEQLARWIVAEWGGIKNLSNNSYSKIVNDIEILNDNIQLSLELKENISSRSKVLSFYEPEKYVICDSRNIFALNWLLFFVQKDEKTINLFTPLSGRNKTLKKFNLETIVETILEKEINYNYKDYSDFCNLIEKLTEKLDFKKIYETEMFIFAISVDQDNGIPFYIKNELKKLLDIKKDKSSDI